MQFVYNVVDTVLYAQINGAGHNYNSELPLYLEKISENLQSYSALIDLNYQKRKKFFKELLVQIYVTKNHWCNHMVRQEKAKNIKDAFDIFFSNLIYLMKTIEKTKNTLHIEREFLKNTKYIGLLHREIGFPRNKILPDNYKLEVKYDNSFCSWNANNDVHKISHIREGNKYNIRITARSIDNEFGFYITGFNRFFNKIFGKKYKNITNEDEVVFRIKKETVITTEKIPLNI